MQKNCLLLLLLLNSSALQAQSIMAMFLFVSEGSASDKIYLIFQQDSFNRKHPQFDAHLRFYGPGIEDFAKQKLPLLAREHALEALTDEKEFLAKADMICQARSPIHIFKQELDGQVFIAVAFLGEVILKTGMKKWMEQLIMDAKESLAGRHVSKDINLKLKGDYLAYKDKIQQIQEGLDEAKKIMMDNMEKVEKRGQNLKELDEMALNLNIDSGKFKKATDPKGCCN